MIFGLNLPNYSTLGHRDTVIAIAERAEELGYSSLWASDHILVPASLPEPYGNLLESFATLSYLAVRTGAPFRQLARLDAEGCRGRARGRQLYAPCGHGTGYLGEPGGGFTSWPPLNAAATMAAPGCTEAW